MIDDLKRQLAEQAAEIARLEYEVGISERLAMYGNHLTFPERYDLLVRENEARIGRLKDILEGYMGAQNA